MPQDQKKLLCLNKGRLGTQGLTTRRYSWAFQNKASLLSAKSSLGLRLGEKLKLNVRPNLPPQVDTPGQGTTCIIWGEHKEHQLHRIVVGFTWDYLHKALSMVHGTQQALNKLLYLKFYINYLLIKNYLNYYI